MIDAKEDNSSMTALCQGFSKLSREEREKCLIQMGVIIQDDINILKKETSLSEHLANNLIENAIGCLPIPLGVAVNFVIDGKEYIIPMAIEETSVIAGASKTAKWIRESGSITTKTLNQLGIGQIQIARVKDFTRFKTILLEKKNEFINLANGVMSAIVLRGGGVRDIHVRSILREDTGEMAVVHVMVDTCDSMGANSINQVCEFLKPHIENATQEKVTMCILSNLADTNISRAEVIIRDIDPELGEAIAEGSLFAQLDPYRAATNNKGVMNGIDAVLLATGNDWRAVEAAVHAYAASSGRYKSITRWTLQGTDLHGILEAPIQVGIVGGVTRLHPVANICLNMLGVESAAKLARIVAAVGLVQNLTAIRALVTHGIIQGHMKLHISNLAMASGADHHELPTLKQRLTERLQINKHLTGSDVQEIIKELRDR